MKHSKICDWQLLFGTILLNIRKQCLNLRQYTVMFTGMFHNNVDKVSFESSDDLALTHLFLIPI